MGMDRYTSRFDLVARPIEFVTASEISKTNNREDGARPRPISNVLNGEQAKKIYEEIINEDLTKTTRKIIPKKRTRKIPKKNIQDKSMKLVQETDKTLQDFFIAAQSGDFDTVKKCIETCGIDIDATDNYMWTPLMMSAFEGHRDIVIFLLVNGARWMDMVDASGYDARELACLGGHPEVAEILGNQRMHVREYKVQKCKEKMRRNIKREKIWCGSCKCHFYASADETKTHESHLSSTLHLFSENMDSDAVSTSNFYINSRNKGYQLMRRAGWDGEVGLGPSGHGKKYPVKTVLKRDRVGLGADIRKPKARVTHFGANDKKAIGKLNNIGSHERETSKFSKKKMEISREVKEREMTMEFRRSFY